MNVYMGRCVKPDIISTTGRIGTDGVKCRDRLKRSHMSRWGLR